MLCVQVYRSTGDSEAASSLYQHYSAVGEEGGWLELRQVVLARKLPRRMLVQPLTLLQDGQLALSLYILYNMQGMRTHF